MAKKADKSTERIRELENQLKRALADYDNLQKRIEADKDQIIKFSKIIILSKFLDVLDTFENIEEECKEANPGLRSGIELTLDQFKKVLASAGVEEIKTDADFDPRFHEAVDVVAGEANNKIVEVVEKGYKIEDKIIRPAKVRVSKKDL
ncbi:MAG: nucleotide exchange factor GrpE [Candidatus Woykebacteria bacterium RBG_13_40_15]|uniref:Protein GrpE n=1 Tax=Candidatus Woykebacteria bacterium RBG_13_40_15 TaxID=1802593 RepID=A0A1G1W8X8_9BACT|nr:MAG: nucleotide exchange factor GrpE [Candidatus Woykebacteria bacterium RBG_13_40_15]